MNLKVSIPLGLLIPTVLVGVAAAAVILMVTERPPVETVQRGYRGLGMAQVYNPRIVAGVALANQAPAVVPSLGNAGPPSSAVYKNVPVLGNLSVGEFTRIMVAMTNWVAPQQGCGYCHNTENMASDALYTKVVSRRMLQMTKAINANWTQHVQATGVTCYTCHRGQPVPSNIWFNNPGPPQPGGMAQAPAGKNFPSINAGLSSLPFDAFTPFLEQANEIRVVSDTALPDGNRRSIKQTDWTYSLMMHFSSALGVNCTYCHNSRAFAAWDQSSPQRGVAWYGIRMVRELNVAYLDPLQSQFPPNRLGPHGDGPKVNCATCHNGVYKPLYGANMTKDYPELAKIIATP